MPQVLDAQSVGADSSAKVAVLVGEISVASREQAQEVIQINNAVRDVDNVVHKNVATAEETAATSSEMCTEAEPMKGAVGNLMSIVSGASHSDNESSEVSEGSHSTHEVHGCCGKVLSMHHRQLSLSGA
jgi:hypothetical protein